MPFRSAVFSCALMVICSGAQAATVELNFDGEVGAVGGSAGVSDIFVQNLFPIGTEMSARIVLDYTGDATTTTVTSFDLSIGLASFSSVAGSSPSFELTNNAAGPFAIAIGNSDDVEVLAADVTGPSFFGLIPGALFFSLYDGSESLFESATPDASEFDRLNTLTPSLLDLGISFNNASGVRNGIVLAQAVSVSATVLQPVPVPAAGGLLVASLLAFAGLGRRLTRRTRGVCS